MTENVWTLRKCFEQLRFDKSHHLGLGDIRITVDQQDQLSDMFDKLSNTETRAKFWQETARLIEEYRKEGDDRAAEGVVDCRILFNRLFN